MIMSLHTKIKMKKEVSYWSEKLRVLHSSLLSQYLENFIVAKNKTNAVKNENLHISSQQVQRAMQNVIKFTIQNMNHEAIDKEKCASYLKFYFYNVQRGGLRSDPSFSYIGREA